jgi:hypothetical protein
MANDMKQEANPLQWYRLSLRLIMVRAGLATIDADGKMTPTAKGNHLFRPQFWSSAEFQGKDGKEKSL